MMPGFEVRRVMDRYHWVLRGKGGAPIARSYKDYGTRLTAITASENVINQIKGETWNK